MPMTTADTAAIFVAIALACATILVAAAEGLFTLLLAALAAVGAVVIVFHEHAL